MDNTKINKEFFSFLSFTQLNSEEIKLVWEWRNNEDIRKWMYNTEIIPLEKHLEFVDSLTSTGKNLYYLVRRRKIPIGVFSIVNINNKSGEWGYYLAPDFLNQNYGVEFYYYTLKYIFEILKFDKIVGYALVSNKSANSLNNLFGFTKMIVEKSSNNKNLKYYFRELTSTLWFKEIKDNKRIQRLLMLTENK